MKIQCSCGAKFEFDVTPEMAGDAVKFVCPACGLDTSDYVNHLVRQELARSGIAAEGTAVQPAPAALEPPAAPPIRVHLHAASEAELAPATSDAGQRCPKHPGQLATGKCYVCSKPLCPKCMELFGYVCSPRCKAKAEAQGLEVPVYAEQESVREARLWRKTVWTGTALGAVVLGLLGFWFWDVWIGGIPRPVYSVTFAEPAYSGQSALVGMDQLVFLHGDTLARHDLKQKKEIWSCRVTDQQQIEATVAQVTKETKAAIDEANNKDPDNAPKMPNPEKLRKRVERAAAAALELRVRGQNVWVVSPGKIARYDWNSGNLAKEIPIRGSLSGLVPGGNELLQMETESGKQTITHINLVTGESHTEELGRAAAPTGADAGKTAGTLAKPGSRPSPAGQRDSETAGLPVGMAGQDAGKTMDPAKVAEQAQHLSLPGSIALPAILANSRNQERILAEASDHSGPKPAPAGAQRPSEESFTVIPTPDGLVEFSVRLVEARITDRAAMKPSPAKSALNSNAGLNKSAERSNELLNEMQRDRGGETVREDESRYLVTIRSPGGPEAWTGEVIGPPALFPLKTVNVLAANKLVMVFDKADNKLWESSLSFNVTGGLRALDEENARYGQGPCVERKGALYIFDQGVLTAFDLATGNVRWRLPSIGIAGMFFDDQDMMYLNTTTASLDSLKYSNQLDITRKDVCVVMKLDPRTGATLWRAEPGGLVSYVSGKFIYSVHSYVSDRDDDEEGGSPYTADSILGKHATLSIKRLNPANGRQMWEHCQDRAPYDVQFDKNTIRLVFKQEVQVLKFFSL